MKHLALLGDGPHLPALALYLRRSGYAITLLPEPPVQALVRHLHSPLPLPALPMLPVQAATVL